MIAFLSLFNVRKPNKGKDCPVTDGVACVTVGTAEDRLCLVVVTVLLKLLGQIENWSQQSLGEPAGSGNNQAGGELPSWVRTPRSFPFAGPASHGRDAWRFTWCEWGRTLKGFLSRKCRSITGV